MFRYARAASILAVTVAGALGIAQIPAAVATPTGAAAASGGVSAGSAGSAGTPARLLPGSEDEMAKAFYRLLLENTRYSETLWNPEIGSYDVENWDALVTLGNAVLLNFGTYDEKAAGVSKATLKDHTLESLAYAVARNKFVDPAHGTWGALVYWDSTYEGYLADAAHLMWNDLDATTRANVDTMTRGEANYFASVGANPPDPSREGGTTNGLAGGYVSDTKMEEMGTRTSMLAAAEAYLPNDPNVGSWREWLDRWTLNMTGLPVADKANQTPIDGKPIAEWNTAHNIFDTFTSENHGTWNGMYQQSSGAYPGRNIPHYLIAGQPIPKSQLAIPNIDELYDTLNRLGTAQGVPIEHMIGDRQHLYGRSLLPVTYHAMVDGDPLAARAERMLATALEPYVAWAPAGRLIKSNEGTKYETEARAEVAYAYLLHYWRAHLAGDVKPVSEKDYFTQSSGVSDYGPVPGFVAQQTPNSLALTTTKPMYTKFGFVPNHDDWFFDQARMTPSFLPSTVTADASNVRTYSKLRDGVDASASIVKQASGFAGYTTLPTGSVVYATTGTGDDEGSFRLFDLSMPGMPGLDGNRTYTTGSGSVTLGPSAYGHGGTETLTFPATQARQLRMVGVQAQSQWGYSMYSFSAYGPGSGTDLALDKTATASTSYSADRSPDKAIDGDDSTRWGNSADERATMKGWWAVDLGATQTVDKVTIHWQEDAWPLDYRIEASTDGTTWKPVAGVPDYQDLAGSWLNVDGRAGFVVRGSTNPIGVTGNAIALSHGPASGAAAMVVQGYPAQSPATTAQLAKAPQPSVEGSAPSTFRAALTDGYLSLFQLGDSSVTARIDVPQGGSSRTVYRGTQALRPDGVAYDVALGAMSAAVEAPRFVVAGTKSLAGLTIDVADSRTATVRNVDGAANVVVTLTSSATGEHRTVAVAHGASVRVSFAQGVLTPTDDLARGRITYPGSPLPAGETNPKLAVDADPSTAWTPGASDRRMIVNLGAARQVSSVVPSWTRGRLPAYALEVSDDGVTWKPFSTRVSAQYVSLRVDAWQHGDASLAELAVR